MKGDTETPLVASEIAGLWQSYMNETMAVCTLKFFLNNVDDEEIRDLLRSYLNSSEEHMSLILQKHLSQIG